jgi:hypothetical protein
MARAYWEAYTRTTLAPRSLVLATLRAAPAPTCSDDEDDSPASYLPLSAISGEDDADLFLDAEARVQALQASHAPADKSVAQSIPGEQLVAAVFTRIAALTRADDSSQQHVATEAAAGRPRDRTLDRELRYYEAHQNQFPTWREFTQRLSAKRPVLASFRAESPQASCATLSSPPAVGS